MELESITCGNCGAPLRVPPGVQFITCNHCHTSLAVHRDASATYTAKIDQIDARTAEMAGDLAQLRYESEVARLDREWEQERQGYLIKDNDGRLVEPTVGSSIASGVVMAVFGAIWTMVAASMGGGGFALFGLLFIAFGVGSAIYNYSQSTDLEQARNRYEQQRRQLSARPLSAHETAGGPGGPTQPSNDPVEAFLDRAEQQPQPASDVVDAYLDRAEKQAKGPN